MTVGQIVPVAILVVGFLVALWLVITRARGGPRVLGIIGTVLLLLGVLSRFGYQWLIDRYLGQVEDETIVSVLATEVAIGGVLSAAGLILLARAIVVAGWPPKIKHKTAAEQRSR